MTAPAVVLGSTQADDVVAPGTTVDVVRRRSGGGAVLVAPGEVVWADVMVPAGDPLWDADVGRAAWWLGDVWAAALDLAGAMVHHGGLVKTAWSPWVCFAGLGPGEVTVDGGKVVGLASRRTRAGALFQCAVPLTWDPVPLLEALALPAADRATAATDLAGAVLPLTGRTPAEVEAAFIRHLP